MEYKVEPEASLPTNQAICHFAGYIWWGRDEHVVLWKETRWAQTTISLTSCVQDICCNFQQSCSVAKRRADQASILVICWSGSVQYDWLLLLVCIGTTNVSPNYSRTLFHLLRQFVKDIARHTILLPGDHSQCVRCHCNCSFYLHSTQHTSTAQPPAQHSHQRKQVVDKLNISLSFTTFCPELIWIFLKKLLTQLFVNVTMV